MYADFIGVGGGGSGGILRNCKVGVRCLGLRWSGNLKLRMRRAERLGFIGKTPAGFLLARRFLQRKRREGIATRDQLRCSGVERLQKTLMHSQKLDTVGQLARGMAYDFNSPLSSTNGYWEIMSSELRDKLRRCKTICGKPISPAEGGNDSSADSEIQLPLENRKVRSEHEHAHLRDWRHCPSCCGRCH